MKKSFTFRGEVVKYPGVGGWHFVELPQKLSKELRATPGKRVGWGYIPATATIGKTSWKTTLFPTKNEGPCLIAIKADVRKKEDIFEKDKVTIKISLN